MGKIQSRCKLQTWLDAYLASTSELLISTHVCKGRVLAHDAAQPVVLAHPRGVHGGEDCMLVDATIASHKAVDACCVALASHGQQVALAGAQEAGARLAQHILQHVRHFVTLMQYMQDSVSTRSGASLHLHCSKLAAHETAGK